MPLQLPKQPLTSRTDRSCGTVARVRAPQQSHVARRQLHICKGTYIYVQACAAAANTTTAALDCLSHISNVGSLLPCNSCMASMATFTRRIENPATPHSTPPYLPSLSRLPSLKRLILAQAEKRRLVWAQKIARRKLYLRHGKPPYSTLRP